MNKKIDVLRKTGFFHIFGGNVINKIIAFMSSIVLVRILTKSEYGAFTYAWNIYSIVLLANGMGMESGILQISSERYDDKKFVSNLFSYGTKWALKFDLILAALLIFIGVFVPLPINNADKLLIMLSLLPMVSLIFLFDVIYLRSQRRNQDFAKLSLLNTSSLFLISVVCAYLFREKGLILGYYGAYIVSIIFSYKVLNIRLVESNEKLLDKDRKALFSISFVSMCNNGLSQLLYLLDVFVLGVMDKEETILASYKVATMIPSALTFIPMALITYLYPYFAEKRNDGEWCLQKYKKIVLYLGLFNACISCVLCIFAPLIIKILFGEIYLDAVPIFRLLSINYFLAGTFRILAGNLLLTQRKLGVNFFVAIISGCVNVIADIVFIKYMGAMGAALATVLVVVISGILNTSYLVYTFKKNKKI